MGAEQDERQGPRLQAHEAVVAQAVGERHRVVLRGIGRVDRPLQALAHDAAPLVVEALRQERNVHLARRARGEVAQLAEEDLAGNDAEAHAAPAAQCESSLTATFRNLW